MFRDHENVCCCVREAVRQKWAINSTRCSPLGQAASFTRRSNRCACINHGSHSATLFLMLAEGSTNPPAWTWRSSFWPRHRSPEPWRELRHSHSSPHFSFSFDPRPRMKRAQPGEEIKIRTLFSPKRSFFLHKEEFAKTKEKSKTTVEGWWNHKSGNLGGQQKQWKKSKMEDITRNGRNHKME